MHEPRLDLEIIDNQKAVLVAGCPECGFQSRFLLNEISPGTAVLCNCGAVFDITADQLQSVQEKFAGIKKTLE